MLNLVVCIKQVPMVSELPWDSRTGTLKREMAEGMMNPACAHALEAALRLKQIHGGVITAISMGPPMAEEVLREAVGMGADRGVLLSDPRMAGADTLTTSFILSRAIQSQCPDFDLIICGCHSSDSETAQIGPQLAENLDIPGVAYVEHLEIEERIVRMKRISDDFLETLEMNLPGLITVATHEYQPRYATLSGLQDAFDTAEILILNSDDLGLDADSIGTRGSPTRILNVYSPTAEKQNVVLKGSARKIVDELFLRFGDRISAVIGKDLKTDDNSKEDDTK